MGIQGNHYMFVLIWQNIGVIVVYISIIENVIRFFFIFRISTKCIAKFPNWREKNYLDRGGKLGIC